MKQIVSNLVSSHIKHYHDKSLLTCHDIFLFCDTNLFFSDGGVMHNNRSQLFVS